MKTFSEWMKEQGEKSPPAPDIKVKLLPSKEGPVGLVHHLRAKEKYYYNCIARASEETEEMPPKMLPPLMDDRQRVYPIPEIFPEELGRDWRIFNEREHPRVDMENKVIHAPLANDPVSHCIKMQQIGRVKWHEPCVTDMQNSFFFRAVEDARISHLLDKAGINLSPGYIPADDALKLTAAISMMGDSLLVSLMLMTDYTDLGRNLIATYGENTKVLKAFQEAHSRITANPTVKNSIAIAKWLSSMFGDIDLSQFDKQMGKNGQPQRSKMGKNKRGGDFAECGDWEDFYEAAWDELEEDEMLQEIPSAVREQLPRDMPASLRAYLEKLKNQPLGLQRWGTMKVEEPPRVKNIYGKFNRKWKATEEGVLPRYPHRFYLDQKVFARRYKLPGGTVVIDASGSMSLSPQQIETIVEHAPGCTVACYSGTGPGGVLRILARNGVRVDEKWCYAPNGSGNIVDFPALKWAYKQSHPRIWVTDYGVTGIDDCPGTANIVMCAAAVKKGRFHVARHVSDAVKLLKGLGRYYRMAK